jgi:hypothetical protein
MAFWGDIGKLLLMLAGILIASGLFFTLGGKLTFLGSSR